MTEIGGTGAALDGVRVLDLSRVLAGPYCTMMLGDLGADVIKVESPEGDDTRRWGPPFAQGESAYYLCCNRNKRGIVLDLSTEQGRDALKKLAARSDVLVENFRAGTMDAWGLGYADLGVLNSRLVYCSITGYGSAGPAGHLPGYDFVMQGLGGVMSITGEPHGPPQKVGVAIVDLTAGMFALSSILAALRVSDATGQGQHIDMSLFDSHLAWLANVGSSYLLSGELPQRWGNGHPNIVPYQAFSTLDGWIIVAVGNDRQWSRFCESLGREDLAGDVRFATNAGRVENRSILLPVLEELLMARPGSEWLPLFEAAGVPCGPVTSVAEALAHPQVAAREMVQEVDHPLLGKLKMVGSPLKLQATPPVIRRHPPLLGEHTDEVLGELLTEVGG
ncbi:MAG: CoA transferase [Chloroflexota bacterium]|nr:CoA transferase [Chloroflexota bacterium]